jgi:hypothetical protein
MDDDPYNHWFITKQQGVALTGSNPVLTTRLSDPTCLQMGCELLVGSLSYYGRYATIKTI